MRYFTLVLLLIGTTAANAASFKRISFDQLLEEADVVLIAEIDEINSHKTKPDDYINNISDFGVFTTLSLSNIEIIGTDQRISEALIYIEGGIVKTPTSLRSRTIGEFFGVLNTAAPTIRFKKGEKYLWIICGNGIEPVPFCYSHDSILKIQDNGDVSSLNGDPIKSILNGTIQRLYPRRRMVEPKESHGPTPPPGTTNPYVQDLTNDNQNLEILSSTELIEYVDRKRSVINYDQTQPLNPTSYSDRFIDVNAELEINRGIEYEK